MVPIFEAVPVPFVAELVDEHGEVQANDVMETAAKTMLDELVKVAAALRTLRTDDHRDR